MFLPSLTTTPWPWCKSSSEKPPSPRKKIIRQSSLKETLLTDRSPNSGSAMSLTPWDCSIPPVKRITTACARSLTHRLTCSWSASPSPHLPHSRTSAKSGSPKSTTTAPVFPAWSSVPRPICATMPESGISSPVRRCPPSARKTVTGWLRNSALLNTLSVLHWHSISSRMSLMRYTESFSFFFFLPDISTPLLTRYSFYFLGYCRGTRTRAQEEVKGLPLAVNLSFTDLSQQVGPSANVALGLMPSWRAPRSYDGMNLFISLFSTLSRSIGRQIFLTGLCFLGYLNSVTKKRGECGLVLWLAMLSEAFHIYVFQLKMASVLFLDPLFLLFCFCSHIPVRTLASLICRVPFFLVLLLFFLLRLAASICRLQRPGPELLLVLVSFSPFNFPDPPPSFLSFTNYSDSNFDLLLPFLSRRLHSPHPTYYLLRTRLFHLFDRLSRRWTSGRRVLAFGWWTVSVTVTTPPISPMPCLFFLSRAIYVPPALRTTRTMILSLLYPSLADPASLRFFPTPSLCDFACSNLIHYRHYSLCARSWYKHLRSCPFCDLLQSFKLCLTEEQRYFWVLESRR